MRLTGAEIANSGGSKFTQDVTCPWCLTASRLELGLQHVHGDLSMHCHKCGKFSRHKTADKWFDQHQQRMEELKEVWKKIPNDAFVSCRQAMRGTPFVYTVYLGGARRPEEFMSRDVVEHILTEEYGMSWKQAHGALMSAALTPGQRIYLQRHTRLVMAAEDREEMKRQGTTPVTIATGAQVRVNGQDGVFLRYSGNEGFAIVALPIPGVEGFGDAEVPVMDLEVVDAGGPEVAEDFMFDKEMEEGEIGEEMPGEGTLEHALEHIEQAEEIVEDLVLEEGGEVAEGGDDESPEDGDDGFKPSHDEDEGKEEKAEEKDEGEEKDGKPPFMARRKAAMPGAPRPGIDPRINDKLTTLQRIIQDPNTDPQTLAEAQKQWTQLKRQVPAALAAGDFKKAGFFGYRTPDDMEAMERPKHKTKGPKLTDGKFDQSAGWVPKNEDKNPLPKEDTNLTKVTASRDAQRRVHTHYAHSGDLRRAIEVNRDNLSIEDIRDLCKHFANTGKIAHYEADELAFWFIGDKPRLLSANDMTRTAASCPACGGPGMLLGKLGKRTHFRCRNCGMDFSKGGQRTAGPAYDQWLKKKQPGATSTCTCKGAYDRYCPEHGAQESKHSQRTASERSIEDFKKLKTTPEKKKWLEEEEATMRKEKEDRAKRSRGALSLRDLRVSAKDAGEAEVPDAHPESGVNPGSGATSVPDPKWQSGESANSITGPEKVKDHGTGGSPKETGDVKTPDLGVPKGAFRRKADGTCQKCGTPLNQAGQCPTCNSSAEQQQAQDSPVTPTTALSTRDLDKRKGAAHKPGCGCGFCSRMKENSDWSKSRKKEPKTALSASDMKKVAHDEVGIFMPALHNGTRVLVIAVDNTSLRATVQDGEGNQRQVDFADLNPVSTGPYSGMAKKPDPGAR